MINNNDIKVILKTNSFTIAELGRLYRQLDIFINKSKLHEAIIIKTEAGSLEFERVDDAEIWEL